MENSGQLFLCATPIGNLEDITLRVLRILKEVDLIAAEDTRHTLKLLNHFEIQKPIVSYHEHNKIEKGEKLIRELKAGKNIALVTDAGMPGISDPGADLVRLCITHDITFTCLPGPVAAICGLVMSGLCTRRFVFEGFLSAHKKERKQQLEAIKEDVRTLIFYEAPHKLKTTLTDMLQILGNRNICIAREMTKKFEELIRCTLQEALALLEQQPLKGEIVLIIEGEDKQSLKQRQYEKWENIPVAQHIQMYISEGLSKKDAMKKVAQDRGVSKREIYAMQVAYIDKKSETT